MQANGPSEDNIGKFKAAYVKNVALVLKDNSFWLGYLSGQYENNEDPLQVLDISKLLEKINTTTLTETADTFLGDQHMITFELLPGIQ
jgi:zinc protease